MAAGEEGSLPFKIPCTSQVGKHLIELQIEAPINGMLSRGAVLAMLGQTFQPDFGERQMKKRDKYFYDTIFRRPSGDVTLEVRLQPDDKITKFLEENK